MVVLSGGLKSGSTTIFKKVVEAMDRVAYLIRTENTCEPMYFTGEFIVPGHSVWSERPSEAMLFDSWNEAQMIVPQLFVAEDIKVVRIRQAA